MFPSGTVTFLFTDVEDSTRLWEESPQAMKGALARHDAILQSAVEKNGGAIVKSTGDGVFAVFPDASAGASSVLVAQSALGAEPWGETGPLRVRMGLHSGPAEPADGDYHGTVVNRAARIMSAAAGGQILLSGSTAELLRKQPSSGTSLLNLGEHHLRGLQQPVTLFQLLHPDLRAEFPPLKTLGAVPNNLPEELTSFVGREPELVEVRRLLEPEGGEGSRLLTLVGPGGTGKTRLALQAARKLLQQFPHGVWMAELAPITEAARLIDALAAPIGLREQGGRSLELIVIDHLRPQQTLLILDNCEHLVEECARVANELLRACPRLHILATSREALGIAGEWPYRVPSLALPPSGNQLPLEELAGYEAVRLFVERAVAAESSFTLDRGNASYIAQICRRLDGIPLAIELAAARARVLSPAQIAERLDDRFRLLTGGSRTALPRQRTLQALIDWSYDLLSDAERTLLTRLSVFSGGWTLEAAEAVAGFEPLESYEVLDLLEQLVNKSLVAAESTELGMRYSMLESIRQYAQEKAADVELLRERHQDHFLSLSLDAYEAMMDLRPPGDWGERFKPEADNFRAAWSQALACDQEAALRFAGTFTPPWSQVVPLMEVHRFQKQAIASADNNPGYNGPGASKESRILLCRALASAAAVAMSARWLEPYVDYALRCVAMAEETGDEATLVWARWTLNVASAFTRGRDALQLWLGELHDQVMVSGRNYIKAMSLVVWGSMRFFGTGRYTEESARRWNEGMIMLRRSGNLWVQAAAIGFAADLSQFLGKLDRARQLAEQVLDIFTELGDSYAANPARSLLADLARRQGDLERAAALYRETIVEWRDAGRIDAGVRTAESLAFVTGAMALENEEQARQVRLAEATVLLGAADATRKRIGRPVSFVDQADYERDVSALREALGDSAFQSAWEQGQRMDFDQAILLITQ